MLELVVDNTGKNQNDTLSAKFGDFIDVKPIKLMWKTKPGYVKVRIKHLHGGSSGALTNFNGTATITISTYMELINEVNAKRDLFSDIDNYNGIALAYSKPLDAFDIARARVARFAENNKKHIADRNSTITRGMRRDK